MLKMREDPKTYQSETHHTLHTRGIQLNVYCLWFYVKRWGGGSRGTSEWSCFFVHNKTRAADALCSCGCSVLSTFVTPDSLKGCGKNILRIGIGGGHSHVQWECFFFVFTVKVGGYCMRSAMHGIQATTRSYFCKGWGASTAKHVTNSALSSCAQATSISTRRRAKKTQKSRFLYNILQFIWSKYCAITKTHIGRLSPGISDIFRVSWEQTPQWEACSIVCCTKIRFNSISK